VLILDYYDPYSEMGTAREVHEGSSKSWYVDTHRFWSPSAHSIMSLTRTSWLDLIGNDAVDSASSPCAFLNAILMVRG
jgi:hypothetical protein